MFDHGKMNAQLLTPSYWEKIKLPAAVNFAKQFQQVDQLAPTERQEQLEKLLQAMAKQGYNNPANPVWALYSAVLVQRK